MKMFKSEEGFTGLEAAIVLIAFVVVAAVFSYVVLGAGFFTTQKAQETVYSSVDMASSSVEILGDVYGWGNEEGVIDGVQFVVGLTAGGSSVDFAQTSMVFTNVSKIVDLNKDGKITSSGTDVVNTSARSDLTADTWYIIDIQNNEGDDKGALLENQEQFTIYTKLGTGTVTPNEAFTIEIKPPVGASYAINRKGPARITNVSILY